MNYTKCVHCKGQTEGTYFNICKKCFDQTQKPQVVARMLSYQNGRGKHTTEDEILELIKNSPKINLNVNPKERNSNNNH